MKVEVSEWMYMWMEKFSKLKRWEDRGGKTVRDKLRETFKKYENTDIKEINVVLDNPTFIGAYRDNSKLVKELQRLDEYEAKR